MGYMAILSPCLVCKVPFFANPYSVPSYQGEPICESCIRFINGRRKANGLPLWPVAADAYEPVADG